MKRLAFVLALAGCSSPVAKTTTGGEPAPPRSSDENPFRDPADEPTRDEIVTRFFAARGIVLTATAEAPWVAFGSDGAIVVTVKNGGAKELRLVAERTSGWWPFRSTEKAHAALHVAATLSTPASGVRSEEVALPAEFATLTVAPGTERSLRLPMTLTLPSDVDCAVTLVRAVLHPLAVVVGDEPERVIALRLPEVRVAFGPKEVALAPADAAAPLELALRERPDLVVSAAIRRGEHDRFGAIEELIQSLPGPSVPARRARCTALGWLTGERHGDSVERWRGWWESKERGR